MFKFRKCLSSFVSDEYASLNDLLHDESTIRTVNALSSVQAIQILIPKTSDYDQLKLPLKNSSLNYYLNGEYDKGDDSLKYVLIKNSPIHFILHPHFLTSYVHKGQLLIQTANRQLSELDDHISLTPDNKLFICVNQSTYTSLGLIGQLAFGYKRKSNFRKYIIELDLNDSLLIDFESKFYKRTFNALKNSGLKLDLVLKWTPNNESASPLSLLRFFNMLKYQDFKNDEFFDERSFEQIEIHQCAPNLRKFELDQFPMPYLDKESRESIEEKINENQSKTTDDFSYCELNQLIDSFGLALTGSYLPDAEEEDGEVNSFRLDKVKLTNLVCLEIVGCFNADNVRGILSELFELIKLNSKLEYTVLIVNGFENSLRSWSGQSNLHLKQLSGENLYGLFMSRNYTNFIWRLGEEKDFGIEKL